MFDHMLEPPRAVRRLEVITGAGGRRRWSADEKARILEEAMAPGAVVSEVARRHGMSPQHLFTWCESARKVDPSQGKRNTWFSDTKWKSGGVTIGADDAPAEATNSLAMVCA